PHPARGFAALSPLPPNGRRGDLAARGGMTLTLLQVVVTGLLVGAVYALFSSGLSLIWGMMNVINFAHGDFVMLGMYTAFVISVWLHGGPAAFGPIAAVLLFGLGALVYYGM